uniref:Uncharacterized protein n=1 Tax=Arundo donax TaxID=35708 RepID=A0A0A8ZMC5_ARUDO
MYLWILNWSIGAEDGRSKDSTFCEMKLQLFIKNMHRKLGSEME